MTIILDAMGSDEYPEPEIQAALDCRRTIWRRNYSGRRRGPAPPRLEALNTKKLPVTIEHAPDVLEMGDKAVNDSKKKPNNSMAVGMKLVKSGRGPGLCLGR